MRNSNALFGLALLLFAGFLFYLLAPVLTPFFLATLLAYLGDPLVDRLQRWRLSRTTAVVTVFCGIFLFFALIVLVVIPAIGGQIDRVVGKLPNYGQWLQQSALPRLAALFDITPGEFQIDDIIAAIKDNLGSSATLLKNVLAKVTGSANWIISFVSYLVLVPVITFYMLRDWDAMVAKTAELVPRKAIGTVTLLVRRSDEVLGGFLRGQLLVMSGLGLIYAVGLTALGLDMAIAIGIFAGLVSFVPYLGLIVGMALAGGMALLQFQDVSHLVGVVAVFCIAQAIEGMVLTPKFVGDRIGLHPVAVLFAVLAGGQLFGFMGVLLALPAAAVINVFLGYCKQHYLQSDVYADDDPAPPEDPETEAAPELPPPENPEP